MTNHEQEGHDMNQFAPAANRDGVDAQGDGTTSTASPRGGGGQRRRRLSPLRRLLVVLAALGGSTIGGVALASPALAGTNGQQITFNLGVPGNTCNQFGSLTNVSITGSNQAGSTVTWRGASSNGRSVTTTGWWWKNTVTVSYTDGGRTFSTRAYVPQGNQPGYQLTPNVVTVNCGGTVWYGSKTWETGQGYNLGCVDLGSGNIGGHYWQYTTFSGYWEDAGSGIYGRSVIGGALGWEVPFKTTATFNSIDCGL